MTDYERYTDPLVERYASREMVQLFSPQRKFSLWRRLWLALAKCEKDLGLDITDAQIKELEAHLDDIDFAKADVWEKKLRHDVMAHIHTWREQCPSGGKIVHLGATSCFVTDNADLIIMRDALDIVAGRMARLIDVLAQFARAHAARPTLGFTHFQPAQLTTVGKRACLWLQDLCLDMAEIESAKSGLRFRGAKGATGTQDSFMKLFDDDGAKVDELDRRVSEAMGFRNRYLVTGQTYTRKVDSRVLYVLAEIAQSAHKFSNDMRLLCHLREVEEPFEDAQIGSSAMPYKRNPMRSERVASLSRFVIALAENGAYTAATQWFERTLDDSANRRLSLPQSFMAIDAVLVLMTNIAKGLIVREKVIARNVAEHLPFIASEELLMKATQRGGDRQELHEKLRRHSVAALERTKNDGLPNDLVDRLAGDPSFGVTKGELTDVLRPERFIGRAPDQVEVFLKAEVDPIVRAYAGRSVADGEVRV